ncbi:MAG: NADH-quinone oxidoreductase subunit M [Actinomycetota bacterium]|nr:NADH-quinone oxidoreductase subunit M [Actinomycetota bacterium]
MREQLTIHLSILLFWPAAFALLGALAPRRVAPALALIGALVPLGYAIVLLVDFDAGRSETLQYVTDATWIPELGIRYKLGLDGLNLWLVSLAALLFAMSALWVTLRPMERPRLFAFHFGVAETAVLGAFLAQDLALFVLFFDLMLVPFYFLMGQWGGPDRVAATAKMIIYTLVGSLLMLAGAVATAVLADAGPDEGISFVLSDLAGAPLSQTAQRWIFVSFALAFLIKMPAFPFHGWMPDAYRNMPLPVLAVFSGALSKVAAYGFLRIVLPTFPDATVDFQTTVLILGLISIIYGSAMAFTTRETRLVLGYSSIAQLGFIVLGIFSLQPEGAQGAILQAVNHGLVVAPLFFIVALLAERSAGSESLRDMGGIAFRAPVLGSLFLIVALATLAIPGSANFAGEFLILLGLFETKRAIALLAFTGVALASVYMLRAYIRSMHNRPGPEVVSRDLSVRDGFVLVPLVLAILAFALYPQAALEDGERGTQAAVRAPQAIAQGKPNPALAGGPTEVQPGIVGVDP